MVNCIRIYLKGSTRPKGLTGKDDVAKSNCFRGSKKRESRWSMRLVLDSLGKEIVSQQTQGKDDTGKHIASSLLATKELGPVSRFVFPTTYNVPE
jgi:hypothetical protein